MQVTRIKKDSSKWSPRLVTSDGDNYYTHCFTSVWRDNGKRMAEVAVGSRRAGTDSTAPNTSMTSVKHGMVFSDGALWACGNNLQTSVDRGENWNVVATPDQYFLRLVATADGLYSCGITPAPREPRGFIAWRPNRGTFDTIYNHTCPVSALCVTKRGVVFGDIEGGVWLLNDGKSTKLSQVAITTAHGPSDSYPIFWDAIETSTGTLVFVGVQGIYRSTDGGATFVQSQEPSDEMFSSVIQHPSGAIIAVGMIIAASTDDAQEFSELFCFEGVGYGGSRDSCLHKDGVLVASMADGLFLVM